MSFVGASSILGFVVLVFSLYKLFLSNDAMELGVTLLRVVISILGITAILFSESIVLNSAVLLFALLAILILAITRNEVQIKND